MALHHRDIKALTGLRGVAALWVVFYHVFEFDGLQGVVRNFVIHGYLAVDIFFVLSGFVMAMSYQDFFRRGFSLRPYGVFLVRRFARIYPLYLATTLFVLAMNLAGISRSWHVNLPDLLANLLLVQGWGIGETINGPAWSISTELASYLLFPLLAALMLYSRKPVAGAAITVCALALALLVFIPYLPLERSGPLDVSAPGHMLPLVRCVAEFSLGLASYRAAINPALRAITSRPLVSSMLALAVVVLLLVPDSDLAVVALVPALIAALATGKGAAVRLLSSRPGIFLGEISYALYLLHGQFLRIRRIGDAHLAPHLGPVMADGLSLVLIFTSLFVSSWLVFRFFETPARLWLRRAELLISPRSEAAVGASEASGQAALDGAPPPSNAS